MGANAAVQARNRAELSQLGRRLRAVVDAMEDGADDAREALGREGVRRVQVLLTGPKSGPGGASLPGEPPGEITGHLKRSYQYKMEGEGVVIYSDAEYAAYLEFGTSKMDPRPHLRPAVASMLPNITTIVAAHVAGKVRQVR